MIGFPPLAGLAPGQITTLLERGRTVGAFVDGPTRWHRRCRDERAHPSRRNHRRPRRGHPCRGSAVVHPQRHRHRSHAPSAARRRRAWRDRRDAAGFGSDHLRAVRLRRRELVANRRGPHGAGRTSTRSRDRRARCACWTSSGCGTCCPGSTPRIGRHVREPSTAPMCGGRVSGFGPNHRSQPWYVAVHGEPGAETGFARYRPIDTEKWFVSDQRTIVGGRLLRTRHQRLPRAVAISSRARPH